MLAQGPVLKYFLNPEAEALGNAIKAPRELDAGFDVATLRDIEIPARGSILIETGVHLGIPEGWVALVRDRSSVALRGGVTAAGVIDASYRGELKILMYNLTDSPLQFKRGERVAQCLVLPHLSGSQSERVSSLDGLGETERGAGGFGSTGK